MGTRAQDCIGGDWEHGSPQLRPCPERLRIPWTWAKSSSPQRFLLEGLCLAVWALRKVVAGFGEALWLLASGKVLSDVCLSVSARAHDNLFDSVSLGRGAKDISEWPVRSTNRVWKGRFTLLIINLVDL